MISSVTFAQTGMNIDSLTRVGAMNAVKKAYQMTDLPICPMSVLSANKYKNYQPGKEAKGLIYSSVKELDCFVGHDVSFHTFMTALHNPQSVLYSERVDTFPYHGANCMAYYGTVCSSLVTYALGLNITQRSADIPVADYMELVQKQDAKNIRVADVLWRKGHVALITDIMKNRKGEIIKVEICQASKKGCNRFYKDGESAFNNMLVKGKWRIYRYKYLYKNTTYTPINEFVAVGSETKLSFKYNDDICTSKGDKACYVTGENVILNVFGGGDKVEIYKDSIFYKEILINQKNTNVVLEKYPYGDYQARVVNGRKKSDFTKWKIIDVNVSIDKENKRICFSSANAIPVYYEFCNISGGRPTNKNRVYAAEFEEKDLKQGFVEVEAPAQPTKGKRGHPFVKVHFECDYGRVINKPINWFK